MTEQVDTHNLSQKSNPPP